MLIIGNLKKGTCRLMVSIIDSGLGYPSSNPEHCISYSTNNPREGINPTIFPSDMGK